MPRQPHCRNLGPANEGERTLPASDNRHPHMTLTMARRQFTTVSQPLNDDENIG
jgi:hypothetical protein